MRLSTLIPLGTTLLIVGLFAIVLVYVLYGSRLTVGRTIQQDLHILEEVFEKIHRDCVIMGFDYEKNPINFLNVKTFTGSEVGPMNLMYPEKWQGPYMQDNPTVQAKEYQIVRVQDDYFIVPGDGVKLPNGKVMGTDIIINDTVNMYKLMADENALMFQGKPLAIALPLPAAHEYRETEAFDA